MKPSGQLNEISKGQRALQTRLIPKLAWLKFLNPHISRSRAIIKDFLIFYKSYSLDRSRRKPLFQCFSLSKIFWVEWAYRWRYHIVRVKEPCKWPGSPRNVEIPPWFNEILYYYMSGLILDPVEPPHLTERGSKVKRGSKTLSLKVI